MEDLRYLSSYSQSVYCYLFVRSSVDVGLAAVLILANILIIIYSYYGYWKIRKFQLSKTVKLITVLIFVEGLLFIAQFIFQIIYYEEVIRYDQTIYASNLQVTSIINNAFFTLGGFIVQWLFLLVTLNITKNTLDYYSRKGVIFPQKIQYINSSLKIYIWIRFIRLVPILIIGFSWYAKSAFVVIVSKVCIMLNMLDSLISFILMLLCYFMIIKPYIVEKNLMESTQTRKLKIQYIALLLAAFYRFLSVLGSFIIILGQYDSDCPEQSLINSLNTYIFGEPFLKILPIIFMVRLQFPVSQRINTQQPMKSSFDKAY